MDRNWAANLIRQACEHARVDHSAFLGNVLHGLQIGAEQYGDTAYRGRDNNREGLAEARDMAAYALMEMADQEAEVRAGKLSAQAHYESTTHLLEAIVAAAKADQAFRLAKYYRND